MSELNWTAIIVATVAATFLGPLWYSPAVFGKAWREASGFDESRIGQRDLKTAFLIAVVLNFVGALVFAMFLGASPDLEFATFAGFSAGLCWVAGSFGINYAFEGKSLKLWAVNGGFHTVQYTLYGVVLGLLR